LRYLILRLRGLVVYDLNHSGSDRTRGTNKCIYSSRSTLSSVGLTHTCPLPLMYRQKWGKLEGEHRRLLIR
jgi:hypothetical protein